MFMMSDLLGILYFDSNVIEREILRVGNSNIIISTININSYWQHWGESRRSSTQEQELQAINNNIIYNKIIALESCEE